ncbi:hypothetical protein [Maricaulis maris]|uniref:Uncharacterized protein n=2 Tax=Maricaulis TaxID=74317 RepID=A0A495D263_9PROT|nr:hypothetical protein [Maricaulis maris]RKQ95625.1 hypothetical protein C7435_2728 [Maricaulis maris]
MYPATDIPFVLTKDEFDTNELSATGLTTDEIRDKERKLRPAKRRYVIDNTAQFKSLCVGDFSDDQVLEFRNCDLFFVTGSFSHLQNAVSPLTTALEKFAVGLSNQLNGAAADFYSGPNTIGRSDVDALHRRYPLSAFKILRLHNTIRAATHFCESAVTDITGDGESTRRGLCENAIVPSVWMVEPRYISEIRRALGDAVSDHTIVSRLRSDYGSNVAENIFSAKLLAGYEEDTGKVNRAYAVTKAFAMALYEILAEFAEATEYTMPPFDLMFPATEYEFGKVEALSKVDGNLITAEIPS